MTLPLYSEGEVRSRGTLGASSASAEDRVGTPTGLSQQGLSQAKLLPALRDALLDYAGVIFIILFAALVLMA